MKLHSSIKVNSRCLAVYFWLCLSKKNHVSKNVLVQSWQWACVCMYIQLLSTCYTIVNEDALLECRTLAICIELLALSGHDCVHNQTKLILCMQKAVHREKNILIVFVTFLCLSVIQERNAK